MTRLSNSALFSTCRRVIERIIDKNFSFFLTEFGSVNIVRIFALPSDEWGYQLGLQLRKY